MIVMLVVAPRTSPTPATHLRPARQTTTQQRNKDDPAGPQANAPEQLFRYARASPYQSGFPYRPWGLGFAGLVLGLGGAGLASSKVSSACGGWAGWARSKIPVGHPGSDGLSEAKLATGLGLASLA